MIYRIEFTGERPLYRFASFNVYDDTKECQNVNFPLASVLDGFNIEYDGKTKFKFSESCKWNAFLQLITDFAYQEQRSIASLKDEMSKTKNVITKLGEEYE